MECGLDNTARTADSVEISRQQTDRQADQRLTETTVSRSGSLRASVERLIRCLVPL